MRRAEGEGAKGCGQLRGQGERVLVYDDEISSIPLERAGGNLRLFVFHEMDSRSILKSVLSWDFKTVSFCC
jgi:hypothetical protein